MCAIPYPSTEEAAAPLWCIVATAAPDLFPLRLECPPQDEIALSSEDIERPATYLLAAGERFHSYFDDQTVASLSDDDVFNDLLAKARPWKLVTLAAVREGM